MILPPAPLLHLVPKVPGPPEVPDLRSAKPEAPAAETEFRRRTDRREGAA